MDVLQQECPDLPVGHSRPFPPASAGLLRGTYGVTGVRGVRASWPRMVRALRQRSVTVGSTGGYCVRMISAMLGAPMSPARVNFSRGAFRQARGATAPRRLALPARFANRPVE